MSALKPGTVNDLAGSMAAAMETAFINEWSNAMGEEAGDAPPMNNQTHLLFVAIAQGVVNYLHDNPDAFKIIIKKDSIDYSGSLTSIEKV